MRSRFDSSVQSGQEIIWSSVSATAKQGSRAGSLRIVMPRTTLVSNGSIWNSPCSQLLRDLLGLVDHVVAGGGDRLSHRFERVGVGCARLRDFAAPFVAFASHGFDLAQRLVTDHDSRLVGQLIRFGQVALVGGGKRRQSHIMEGVDAVDRVSAGRKLLEGSQKSMSGRPAIMWRS